MNNNSNNINQDNYNAQNNNGIYNNQFVNNQSINQDVGINSQSTDSNIQPTPFIQQPVNSIQDSNVNITNNYKKKKKLMLIIALVLIVIVVLITTILLLSQKSKKSINNVNDNANNVESNNIQTNDNTQNNKKDIDNYTWKDLTLSVDGNLIYPGIKTKNLIEYGYEFTSNNLDRELQNYHSVGISFKYNGISIPAAEVFNVHDEILTVENTELSFINLSDEIIKNSQVKLPGGLLLSKNTTIDEIVNSIGKYTKEIAGDYLWELSDEASTMTIGYINNELKYVKLQYTIGTLERVTK